MRKSCRSEEKKLQHGYLLATIGFDPAENEPSEDWCKGFEMERTMDPSKKTSPNGRRSRALPSTFIPCLGCLFATRYRLSTGTVKLAKLPLLGTQRTWLDLASHLAFYVGVFGFHRCLADPEGEGGRGLVRCPNVGRPVLGFTKT